ncbi:myosin phosphatase Rho-interacting protein-like [Melanotaenia boesemani]|uniref:myosin phosphatase Rho-interacting protein-like n=1 Tax=Melanotaenia boesemani TaxID=1250792 RepID=UPI001C04E767|nr:myosin phosphatase Rho-interacting protein-like [Melanotaenia boesemani]
MSKKQRWHETLVNKKTNKPTQKNGGKDLAALAVPACDGGKQTGSGATKTSVSCGRSSSLSSKGGDSTVTGSKFGGSRSSLSHQGGAGHQVNRQASHPSKPALRLRSSRSFSSLQATSLSAAPFMRSSRSLSRLDQRSTESDKTSGRSQVKKGQNTGKKILDSVRLSSSVEQFSSSCQPQTSSSSLVSTTTCHHHNIKEKKQTRDGVYSLCAMTSGMKRNLVQAVLKNVRPGLTHDTTSSLPEQKVDQLEEDSTGEWEEASQQQQPERTAIQQPEGEQSLVDLHSSSSLLPVSSAASPPPSPTSPSHQVEEGEGVHECQLPVETAQTGGIESSSGGKGSPCGSSASKVVLSNNEDFEEHSNRESENEQSLPQREATPQKDEQSASVNTTSECTEDNEALSFEQQTGQLVKEVRLLLHL